MIKVGILTFHCADNYGAVLQCLGMQEFLLKQGYNVEVINYHPKYLLDKHSVIVNPISRYREYKSISTNSKNIILKKTTKSILENVYLGKRVLRKKKFFEYRRKYMRQSKKVKTIYEIENIVRNYDVLICGSDQIWNKQMTNGVFDKVFFLEFHFNKFRKISYAASAGSLIDIKDKNEFIELLNNFDSISVREEKLLKQIEDWTDKQVNLVLDPSMLLTGEEWCNYIEEKNENEKYILVYCLEKNENMFKIIQKIYQKLNIKIIEIDMRRRIKGNRGNAINTLNPGEFLSMIKNAEFIITNSFHGTVFSILFQKDFITIPHLKLGERMRTLLSILGLQNKLIVDENMIDSVFSKINYDEVNNKLKILRENSIDFLINAIVGE